MRVGGTIRLAMALCAAASLCAQQAPAPASSPVLVDRVVAVVNNRAILASDLATEMRLSVLDPGTAGEAPDPRSALEHIVSRTLIQQQMGREEEQAAEPPQKEVQQRLADLRAQLPACVRMNCASDAGWAAFLATHNLTAADVEHYLRLRLEILAFIENRFRQGIRIAPEEIEAYYDHTLVPQYDKGQQPPPLAGVSARIEEILLQQQVNKLFDAWLDNLRKQGDVEILDPALETPRNEPSQGGGDA